MGDQEHVLETGGFMYMPKDLPLAVINLTDQPAELIIVSPQGVGTRSSSS